MSNHNPLNAFIMGSFSGAISTSLFQPFDVTKTRLLNLSKHCSGQRISYIHVISEVYHTNGIRGFWNGLSPSLMRCVPGVGMYFCTLQLLRDHLVTDKPTVFETVFMGAAARSSATVILMPFTILKTRFESGEYSYNGISHAIGEIRRKEGIRGLTRGLVPTLIRDVPFSGMYYLSYTRIKAFVGLENGETKSSIQIFLCGVCASCFASFVTHPADVLKTYMQLYPAEFSKLSYGFSFIYRKFGVQGYYRGLVVRLTRRTMVTSMSWTVYERINEWLQSKL